MATSNNQEKTLKLDGERHGKLTKVSAMNSILMEQLTEIIIDHYFNENVNPDFTIKPEALQGIKIRKRKKKKGKGKKKGRSGDSSDEGSEEEQE